MSKKSKIDTFVSKIQAFYNSSTGFTLIMVCFILIAFFVGRSRGYHAGYTEGLQDGNKQIIINSERRTYESDPESMANLIVAADGNLLPVTNYALDKYVDGLTDKELYRATGISEVKAFYECLGITIGEEVDKYPGWYHCTLPEGWTIHYDASPYSRDEEILFYDADGYCIFRIITEKNAGDHFATLTGYHNFPTKADFYGTDNNVNDDTNASIGEPIRPPVEIIPQPNNSDAA